MYAIIETGGKQYKVSVGDVIKVEKLSSAIDENVEFKVVAFSGDNGMVFGTPYVESCKVVGKVLEISKDKKITVFTYKPKKGEKRKLGHRQPFSKVIIDSIG